MIGIIGQGFVGNAVYQKFKTYYDVKTFDLDTSKGNSTFEEVMECDTIFVCLPTPMNSDGSCNVSIIENTLEKMNEVGNRIVVIKSTIIPSTTERFNRAFKNLSIVFNPEFLTERNAVRDYSNQNRIILGGPKKATTKLKQIFSKVFPKASIIKTDATHAEMVKYLTNTFLSTKVSFANEMYQLCEKIGIDYDKVVEYAIYDGRLGYSHWAVPGPDGDLGFGGHCLTGNYSVLTTDGVVSLEDYYKSFKKGDALDVKSFNSNLSEVEYKSVLEVTKNMYVGDLYKFELENGKVIECTPEHIFPIQYENKIVLKQAKNITKNDEFFIDF